MAFVKLDCGILRSTLWLDRDARECFITALLMAMPREFMSPTPQLKVRTIEHTGFCAPPGWFGFVDAAGVGIVRQAGLDLQAGLGALERLGEPEADSRTPEYEGRRLIRIDGGYLVLNYMKYRDRDYTQAERQKRYRERQRDAVTSRSNAVTPPSRDASRSRSQISEEDTSAPEAPTDAASTTVPRGTPDDWFLDFKLAYPERAGDPNWRGAAKAARARIAEGHTPAEFLAGAKRYAEFCAATGKIGTEYVKQASTFLGPGKPFLEPWVLPAGVKAPKREGLLPDAFEVARRAS